MLLGPIAAALSISNNDTAKSAPYVAPTDQQLKAWWNGLSTAEQLAQLRTLDAVDHAVPVIKGPRYVAILSGRELTLEPWYENGAGYDLMTLGPWDYHLKWPVQRIPDWAPVPQSHAPEIIGGMVAAALLGALAVALLK